ncbi:MAG: hypothetical protein SFY66_21575 [Oculatellaceae cyanobacterium bins.114]|nr:hypothetical protein [Oculatellaceae cyanobacterium bins.114]
MTTSPDSPLQLTRPVNSHFYKLDQPTWDTKLVQIAFLHYKPLTAAALAIAETLSLKESWENHEGLYLMLGGSEVSLDQALANRVYKLLAEPTFSQTRFLWVENPGEALSSWRFVYLSVAPKPDPPTIDQYSVLDWRNYGLAIARGVEVLLTETGFLFQAHEDEAEFSSQPFVLLTDYGTHRLKEVGVKEGEVKEGEAIAPSSTEEPKRAIALPFIGDQAGCLQFGLTLKRPQPEEQQTYEELKCLDVALRIFFLDPAPPLADFNDQERFSITSHRYPLMGEDAEALSHYTTDLTFDVTLDPLYPLQESRTYFAFRPPADQVTPTDFPSNYRTNLGYSIHLTPQDGTRLVFEERAIAQPSSSSNSFYLVPSGEFAMSVPRYDSEKTEDNAKLTSTEATNTEVTEVTKAKAVNPEAVITESTSTETTNPEAENVEAENPEVISPEITNAEEGSAETTDTKTTGIETTSVKSISTEVENPETKSTETTSAGTTDSETKDSKTTDSETTDSKTENPKSTSAKTLPPYPITDLDNLLCGLSGVEFIKLDPPSVNLLCFRPKQPAFVFNFSPKTDSSTNSSFNQTKASSRFTDEARTAWAFVRQKTVSQAGESSFKPAIYYAQPDLSLLYGASTVTDQNQDSTDNLLSFLEVPVTGLPDIEPFNQESGQPWGFPLLPYGGIQTEDYYRQLWKDQRLPNPVRPYQQLEQQYINPERRSRIIDLSQQDDTLLGPTGVSDVIGVTPQGFLTTYSSDYEMLESLLLAKDTAGKDVRLTNLPQRLPLRDAFQSNQMFLVISDYNTLTKYLTDNQLVIQDWTFDFNPSQWREDTVLIFKFFEKPLLELLADETTWSFKEHFNSNPAIGADLIELFEEVQQRGSKDATPRDRENYEYLAQATRLGAWSGIIALNVKVPPSEIPEELRALAVGIKEEDFFAQYVVIETTQVLSETITAEGQKPRNVLKAEKSSLFALIDYRDDAIPAVGPSGYAFQVSMLRVLFQNSYLKAFSSEVSLTVDQLFNEGTRLLNSRTGRNLLTFKGTAENQDGKPKYTFSFSGESYFATLDSHVLDSINIVKANFSTDPPKKTDPPKETDPSKKTDPPKETDPKTITGRFTLWGQFNFRFLDKFDAIGFGSSIALNRAALLSNSDQRDTVANDLFQPEAQREKRQEELEKTLQVMETELNNLQDNQQVLPFSNVQITMTFLQDSPDPKKADSETTNPPETTSEEAKTTDPAEAEEVPPNPNFTFDAGQLIYDLKQAKPRPNSLYAMFPLQLASFVQIGPDTQPKGFMAVKNPLTGGMPTAGYGFIYDLNLGSLGALSGSAQLQVKVLVAWTPNTDGQQTNPQVFVGLQLPGIGGDVLGFPIQSVLKLSFKSLEFVVDRPSKDTIRGYLLKMRNLALKILVLSLPPTGQTELILFGNPKLSSDPSLRGKSEAIGWYAAYAKDPPPPDATQQPATRTTR